jgi:hypothetical protein
MKSTIYDDLQNPLFFFLFFFFLIRSGFFLLKRSLLLGFASFDGEVDRNESLEVIFPDFNLSDFACKGPTKGTCRKLLWSQFVFFVFDFYGQRFRFFLHMLGMRRYDYQKLFNCGDFLFLFGFLG